MKSVNFLTLTIVLAVVLSCNKTELIENDKIDENTFVENMEEASTDESPEIIDENPEDIPNNEDQVVSDKVLQYLLDCDYEQSEQLDGRIDETERAIMKECSENSLNNNKSKLIENLIGEWELIGHGNGWIPNKRPCVYLDVAESYYTVGYKSAYLDTVATYNWSIYEREVSGELTFYAHTDVEIYSHLAILGGVVSDNYMYSDATPFNGEMYLFQKVQ